MMAVAGGKGGCGKTTTALGIARVLSERERVTVVDADVDMPDLHVVTDTPVKPGLGALAAGAPIEDCRHRPIGEPGVSIVPAGDESDDLDVAFERLRGTDRRVIVDTPAGASKDATRPLRAADTVVLVSTPTRESLVDTAKTAAMARSFDTPVVGLVVNRSDGSIEPTDLFDCDVLAHVPTTDAVPHRSNRSSYAFALRNISKRNT